jgi:hypothetical protein
VGNDRGFALSCPPFSSARNGRYQACHRTKEVQQTALAHVWRAEDGQTNACAHDFATPIVSQDRLYPIPQTLCSSPCYAQLVKKNHIKETDGRTLFEHTLFNILALSEIDERFDKRETADDLFT